jgi:hypothetical protein
MDGGPAKKVGKQRDWNDIKILIKGNRASAAIKATAVLNWRDREHKRLEESPIRFTFAFQHGAAADSLKEAFAGDFPQGSQSSHGVVSAALARSRTARE